ncbi:MAG: hypothetical protein ACK40H_01935, partial [Sphingomonadaceae bacterium]
MRATASRRQLLGQLALAAPAVALWRAAPAGAGPAPPDHGLRGEELARWTVPEANQAAAVDASHFY